MSQILPVIDENGRHFEEFIDATGNGIYYKYLLSLTCICNFLCASTLLTIPIAVSIAGCANGVPNFIIISIFIFFVNGRNLGGFCTGCFSDRYGRKRELMYSIVILFVATFISAFAYNYYILIGTSFILGLGLEGTSYTMNILFTETLPSRSRGSYVFFTKIFWTLGYISTSLFAIYLEKSYYENDKKTPGTYLSTWRITYAICGGLSLVLACCCALLEESSRHFLCIGKTRIGYLVLKQFYAINKSSYAENFEVQEEEMKSVIKSYDLDYEEPQGYLDSVCMFCVRIFKATSLLFSRRFMKATLLLMMLKIPFIVFGTFEMNILLSRHLDETINSTTAMEYIYPLPPTMNYTYYCYITERKTNFFKNYLIISPGVLIGDVLGFVLVDRFGRRFIISISSFLAGILLGITCLLEISSLKMQSFVLIMIFHSVIWSTLNLICIESFPTSIRGTALGFTNIPGYFLSMFAAGFMVIKEDCFAVAMGAVFCCCSILCCLLDEFKRKPMVE